jgi:hypothetical protein
VFVKYLRSVWCSASVNVSVVVSTRPIVPAAAVKLEVRG